MSNLRDPAGTKDFQASILETFIQISLLVLLVLWCFNIVKPFLLPLLWAAIFTVALHPLFMKLQAVLGGREKLTATLITLVSLAILITPTFLLSSSLIEGSITLSKQIEAETMTIPPPPEHVKEWPLLGKPVYRTWSLASNNLGDTLKNFKPELEAAGRKLLSITAGVSAGILMFFLAIIVAGVLMVYARSARKALDSIANRLTGGNTGGEIVDMAGATIRSVAQGVLGVALIQSILAGIGFMLIGVPYAGLWALLVLLLAIVQLPTVLIMGPIIVYVFTVTDTVPAVTFTIWSLLVGVSDTFLKPLFLGRGMDIPMPVILLGAIGGMILSGIIGLFVGAVVLAVGYRLFIAWLAQSPASTEP